MRRPRGALTAPAALGLLALAWSAPAAAKLYRYPLPAGKGTPTSYFDHSGKDWNCGSWRYSGHRGNDYGAPKGTKVVAAASGTVVYTNDGCADNCSSGACGCGGGYGNYVKIKHADGKHTYYAHLQTWSVKVKKGDKVGCGQHIGNVASSGNSTGNHLHFEVRCPSVADDPFTGKCSGPLTYWVQQGPYKGRPGTTCATTPKPDAGPPPPDQGLPPTPDSKPPPPPLDSGAPSQDSAVRDHGGGASDLPPPAADHGVNPALPDNTLVGGCSAAPAGPAGGAAQLVLPLLVLLVAARRRRG